MSVLLPPVRFCAGALQEGEGWGVRLLTVRMKPSNGHLLDRLCLTTATCWVQAERVWRRSSRVARLPEGLRRFSAADLALELTNQVPFQAAQGMESSSPALRVKDVSLWSSGFGFRISGFGFRLALRWHTVTRAERLIVALLWCDAWAAWRVEICAAGGTCRRQRRRRSEAGAVRSTTHTSTISQRLCTRSTCSFTIRDRGCC
jgi:hypothetical protein